MASGVFSFPVFTLVSGVLTDSWQVCGWEPDLQAPPPIIAALALAPNDVTKRDGGARISGRRGGHLG